MSSSDSSASGSTLTYVVVILFAVYVLNSVFNSNTYKLRSIPTAGGPSAPILCMYSVINVLMRGPAILQEATRKYKESVWKFATMEGWIVVVTKASHIDELGRASERVLSMDEALKYVLQTEHSLGKEVAGNGYHNAVVSSLLTRELEALYPDLYDETVVALNDHISLNGDDWTSVPAMATFSKILVRASNRTFVGIRLCRKPEYCELTRMFSFGVMKTAGIVNLAPKVIQPLVGRLVSTLDATIDRCSEYTGPVISERLQMREKYGKNWADKPLDALQSLIEIAPEKELNVRDLTRRLLSLNFSAGHTLSMNFTTALLYLASNSTEYLPPLREEVDAIVAEYGWSRDSLRKMHKIDSFVKESLRMYALGAVTSLRLAVKDFTFSDGTHIPAGTYVSVASRAVHRDESIYTDPYAFNPWRFSDKLEANSDNVHQQIVNTNCEYLPFGCGRHTCPGRFFVAVAMKTMLAQIVTKYDVKIEEEGAMPFCNSIAMSFFSNTKAHIMLRKRQPQWTV